jgi:hypothetical protein
LDVLYIFSDKFSLKMWISNTVFMPCGNQYLC